LKQNRWSRRDLFLMILLNYTPYSTACRTLVALAPATAHLRSIVQTNSTSFNRTSNSLSRLSYSHSTVSIKYLNPHITAAHSSCSQAFKTSGAMSRSSEAMRHRIRVVICGVRTPAGSNFQGGRRFSTALLSRLRSKFN